MRRQNRAAIHKEKQEMIQMGLLPPEQPKVKMSNLMRVLGDQAILDPTKMEQVVKAQVDDRAKSAIAHDESKKLTREEKSQKKVEKMLKDVDPSGSVNAAVFRYFLFLIVEYRHQLIKKSSRFKSMLINDSYQEHAFYTHP